MISKFINKNDNPHKKVAFTLAEVLITLGIIGIVAALTIPTLIANTNSKRFISQFKKSLSTLSQAGLMGQAHHDSNYATLSQQCMGETDSLANGDSTFCGLFNVTLKGAKYVGDISKLTAKNKAYTIDGNTPNGYTGYFLADGALVYFPSTGSNCTRKSPCQGYIDVNGATLPNKFVRCVGHENDSEFYSGECTVAKNNKNDIFPVYFYDSVVSPAGSAARTLLKLALNQSNGNNSNNNSASAGEDRKICFDIDNKSSEEVNEFVDNCLGHLVEYTDPSDDPFNNNAKHCYICYADVEAGQTRQQQCYMENLPSCVDACVQPLLDEDGNEKVCDSEEDDPDCRNYDKCYKECHVKLNRCLGNED